MRPQLTLVWRPEHNNPDPIRVGKWMHNVAAHFRGRVSRFSIFNEPDLYLYGGGGCAAKGLARFLRRNPALQLRAAPAETSDDRREKHKRA